MERVRRLEGSRRQGRQRASRPKGGLEVVGDAGHQAEADGKGAIAGGRGAAEGDRADQGDHFDADREVSESGVVAESKSGVDHQAEFAAGLRGDSDSQADADLAVDVELFESEEVDGTTEVKEVGATTAAALGVTANGRGPKGELEGEDIGDIISDLDA